MVLALDVVCFFVLFAVGVHLSVWIDTRPGFCEICSPLFRLSTRSDGFLHGISIGSVVLLGIRHVDDDEFGGRSSEDRDSSSHVVVDRIAVDLGDLVDVDSLLSGSRHHERTVSVRYDVSLGFWI